jgi:hypothetical protein
MCQELVWVMEVECVVRVVWKWAAKQVEVQVSEVKATSD